MIGQCCTAMSNVQVNASMREAFAMVLLQVRLGVLGDHSMAENEAHVRRQLTLDCAVVHLDLPHDGATFGFRRALNGTSTI